MSDPLHTLLEAASVIPVLSLDDPADAAPLALALHQGGLQVAEMTLRSTCALEAMQEMKRAVPSMLIGMGTLRNPDQVKSSSRAGADFLVSPGLEPGLAKAMRKSSLPSLPGVATLSEAMQATKQGFKALKFFPAEQSGGTSWLKSVAGPAPDLIFCPTGSISPKLAPDYLALPNVACVGGSWIAPGELIKTGNFEQITKNAAMATKMGRAVSS